MKNFVYDIVMAMSDSSGAWSDDMDYTTGKFVSDTIMTSIWKKMDDISLRTVVITRPEEVTSEELLRTYYTTILEK